MNRKLTSALSVGLFLAFSSICMGFDSAIIDSIFSRAENGEAYYQGVMGSIYRRGEAGEIDYKKAYKWSELSAAEGDPIGLYNLAVLYEMGLYVPKDTIKANQLYSDSYESMFNLAGQGDPMAQVNLGIYLK